MLRPRSRIRCGSMAASTFSQSACSCSPSLLCRAQQTLCGWRPSFHCFLWPRSSIRVVDSCHAVLNPALPTANSWVPRVRCVWLGPLAQLLEHGRGRDHRLRLTSPGYSGECDRKAEQPALGGKTGDRRCYQSVATSAWARGFRETRATERLWIHREVQLGGGLPHECVQDFLQRVARGCLPEAEG